MNSIVDLRLVGNTNIYMKFVLPVVPANALTLFANAVLNRAHAAVYPRTLFIAW